MKRKSRAEITRDSGEAYNLPNFFLRENPGTALSVASTFGKLTQVYNPGYALSGGGGTAGCPVRRQVRVLTRPAARK